MHITVIKIVLLNVQDSSYKSLPSCQTFMVSMCHTTCSLWSSFYFVLVVYACGSAFISGIYLVHVLTWGSLMVSVNMQWPTPATRWETMTL